jgi:hypothetical protein
MAWHIFRFSKPTHTGDPRTVPAWLLLACMLACLAAAGASRPAVAESPSIQDPNPPKIIIMGSPNRLSSSIIRQEMVKLGYSKFGKLRLKSGVIYEMEASDPKGRRYKLIIDPDTARLLRRIRLS